MKNLLYPILLLFLFTISSCTDDSQTIANVKEAAIIAHNEKIHYNFFAEQAAADSLVEVENLFIALSKSSAVQSALLNEELTRLGVVKFQVPSYETTVDSTLSNLYKAHSSNQYDFYNLFPLFAEQAQTENKASSANLFNKILKIKENNIILLDQTIVSLLKLSVIDSTHSIDNLVVCSKCGYIALVGGKCTICN